MNASCPTPIGDEDVADYWAGELPTEAESRIEAHIFACSACADVLAAAGAMAGAVAAAVRQGRLHAVLTDEVLNRLAVDGARIRMFTLDGPAVIPCAVCADDDLVVSRIRADFAGVDMVTIATRQASGEEIARLSDIPVRPGQRELLHAFSAAHLRDLPATRVLVSVTTGEGGTERTLAAFTLEHAGTFAR